MGNVAEVVVRFATTIVEVIHVAPGATWRVGTARDVQLPLRVATSFPLVDGAAGGFVVRRPAGLPGTIDGRPMPPELAEVRLVAGMIVALEVGAVRITVRLTERVGAGLPRAPIDRRPFAYAAGSLGVHLALWALAIVLAEHPRSPPPRVTLRPAIHARIAHEPSDPRVRRPEPPRPLDPPPVTAVASPSAGRSDRSDPGGHPPSRRGRAIAQARGAGLLGSTALGDFSSLIPKTNLAQALAEATFYDEDHATHDEFGHALRWDPGGTIKTGPYETVSEGRGAGDDYDLAGATPAEHHRPVLALCGAASPCRADGPLDTATITRTLQDHARALLGCRARQGEDAPGVNVVLSFEIDRDGAVLRPSARGPREVADCLLGVLERVDFPTAPAQTTVVFPVGLDRS